ncbi:dienelactone hydrolase family protein [Dyadobacter psychrotolerans]|uniref:Dienelactone hydrolase family protein n=1 Tax=Dyadobacter psychrotolerans TaxID=2541721 RepID=A0A4R5DIE7_9BACT|nr:dienelactone hydrolase family protein [Dyadobacter psychrotolerans]TDE10273.1 dienelactone hydrolase family protein [Dyadobacter psychrotolerans]
MKAIFMLVTFFLMNVYAPEKPVTTVSTVIPICHTPLGSNDMAFLAADPSFQMLHELPAPFHYQGAGEMVSFPTPDGTTASGFLLKSAKKSKKWLLVYQEWWGLNDNIKQESAKLYRDLGDVNVIALDMYDGKVGETREEAGKLMQSASKERLAAITRGAISFVGKDAKIASIGWCFGGMLSLQSAILEQKQMVGCVMYYGTPEKDVEKLKTLNTDVLGIFGSQDQGISPAVVAQFKKDMKTAGKQVTIKMYDAVHGFANPSNPKHDPAATADAYKLSLNYLKKKFS